MGKSNGKKTPKKLLKGKAVVVTGCASGIGLATAGMIKRLGGYAIGVDVNKTTEHVDELYIADLSDRETIDALVDALPGEIDGLVNCAGLPPTAPADAVLKVNLVGLKYFTTSMIGKLNDGASIVNIASLAGNRWPESIEQIKAAETLDFDDIDTFIKRHGVGNTDGRSYFFSKEALVVWTMQNRWTWRDRGIRMNTVSPGPVETPILPDFVETLGERIEENRRVMDRFATPDDVAPVVAFMLSDMSAWIRGSNIPVDGGMSSHFLCQMHDL